MAIQHELKALGWRSTMIEYDRKRDYWMDDRGFALIAVIFISAVVAGEKGFGLIH